MHILGQRVSYVVSLIRNNLSYNIVSCNNISGNILDYNLRNPKDLPIFGSSQQYMYWDKFTNSFIIYIYGFCMAIYI